MGNDTIKPEFDKNGFLRNLPPSVYVGPRLDLPEPTMVAHPDPNSNRVIYARRGEVAPVTNSDGRTGMITAGGVLKLDQ